MREIYSCSCLTVLPGLVWVLLSKKYTLFPGALYSKTQVRPKFLMMLRMGRICPAAADAVWQPSIGVGARGCRCTKVAMMHSASSLVLPSDTGYVLLARIFACALHCTPPSNFHHRFTIHSIHLTAAVRPTSSAAFGPPAPPTPCRARRACAKSKRERQAQLRSAQISPSFPFHFVSFRN